MFFLKKKKILGIKGSVILVWHVVFPPKSNDVHLAVLLQAESVEFR